MCNVDVVGAEAEPPFADRVGWAKAIVAAGLNDEVVLELVELLRRGTDDPAELAAWALGFGKIPDHLKASTVQSLLDVLSDTDRPEAVRGQAAEAVAEQLEYADRVDPMRRAAEMILMNTLHDSSAVVRFWSSFALGKLRTTAALPVLRALTGDETSVPRWWKVGEEAADAIDRIEGREPPDRDQL